MICCKRGATQVLSNAARNIQSCGNLGTDGDRCPVAGCGCFRKGVGFGIRSDVKRGQPRVVALFVASNAGGRSVSRHPNDMGLVRALFDVGIPDAEQRAPYSRKRPA